jgi:hypothetical protein
MDNKFIILYVMTIGILFYDSFMIGIMKAQLDIIEKYLKEED